MRVISLRQEPEYKAAAIKYIQSVFGSEDCNDMYENCISYSVITQSPLPRWYLLEDDDFIVGCAGLVTNDFISRMDLYPWLCDLYIDEEKRGQGFATQLIECAKNDAHASGFEKLYLATSTIGYFEKHGFKPIGIGYHPWGDTSRIYEAATK